MPKERNLLIVVADGGRVRAWVRPVRRVAM
jgi:hypothetical protein